MINPYGISGLKVFVLRNLNNWAGIDTQVGELTGPSDDTFLIQTDIEFLAGNYVSEDEADVEVGNSVNEFFFYVNKENSFLDTNDCCAFFTFPNAGPANFISKKGVHFDLVFDIMETFKSK